MLQVHMRVLLQTQRRGDRSRAPDDLKQQDLCSDHNYYAESVQKGRTQMTLRQMKNVSFQNGCICESMIDIMNNKMYLHNKFSPESQQFLSLHSSESPSNPRATQSSLPPYYTWHSCAC